MLTTADIQIACNTTTGQRRLVVEIPASEDELPAPPAGFIFGSGVVVDDWETVELLHLCGEPTLIDG